MLSASSRVNGGTQAHNAVNQSVSPKQNRERIQSHGRHKERDQSEENCHNASQRQSPPAECQYVCHAKF